MPVFCDSTAVSSSARASIASAILSRARLRSAGVVFRQTSRAADADANPALTSSAPQTGAVANVSPVAGLITCVRRCPAPATLRPSMKICSSSMCGAQPLVQRRISPYKVEFPVGGRWLCGLWKGLGGGGAGDRGEADAGVAGDVGRVVGAGVVGPGPGVRGSVVPDREAGDLVCELGTGSELAAGEQSARE